MPRARVQYSHAGLRQPGIDSIKSGGGREGLYENRRVRRQSYESEYDGPRESDGLIAREEILPPIACRLVHRCGDVVREDEEVNIRQNH